MQLEYISASRLETFLLCPMKYYAQYVLGLRDEPGDAARLGTAVHKAMELATEARRLGKSGVECDPFTHLPAALLENRVSAEEDLAKEMINNAIDWGYFRTVGNCVGCEVEFKTPLPDGTNIYGFIDRLDVRANTADIKDLKTGKRPFPEHEVQKKWQGRIYNIAARALYPDLGDLTVSYWVLRHKVQKAVYTAEDAENDAAELIELAMEIVSCDNPIAKPNPLCSWCPHVGCEGRGKYKKKGWRR